MNGVDVDRPAIRLSMNVDEFFTLVGAIRLIRKRVCSIISPRCTLIGYRMGCFLTSEYDS